MELIFNGKNYVWFPVDLSLNQYIDSWEIIEDLRRAPSFSSLDSITFVLTNQAGVVP